MSLEVLHATAAGLLDVVRRRDWLGEGMDTAARFQLDLFDCHDRFIAAGRTATVDFRLWNAYLRTWLLWSILSALSLKRARMDAEAGTGPGRWAPVERFDRGEFWYQVPSGLPELLDESLTDVEAVRRGANPDDAADRIRDRLREAPFVPPLFKFGDLGARYYEFTRGRRLRMLLWTKTAAPADFRRLLTADNVTAAPVSHQAATAGSRQA
jgi:FADH2 O2-dependent halogenase